MNCQNRVGQAKFRALVDDLLRAAFDLGVAALHRVEVELRCVRSCRHRTGRAAAHTDAHARPAQLNQQCAGRKLDLLRQRRVNRAEPTRNHDRLVVAPALATHRLLVFAEVTGQIRPAKLVVEGRATQRAFRHDLQRAGDVVGLAISR